MSIDPASNPPAEFDPLADETRDVFELRYDLQQACAGVARLTKELGREKRCYQTASEGRRVAWDQLRRIAELMGAAEDDIDVTAVAGDVERYVDQVKSVTERLTRERDEAHEHLDKVRVALKTPDGWATKMHALHVRQQRDKGRDLLGAIWLYVPWRSITRHLTTEQRELWADAVEVAGDPGSTIAADRWWRNEVPVSGSDTATGFLNCGCGHPDTPFGMDNEWMCDHHRAGVTATDGGDRG